jgi:hypothetical protein
LCPAGDFTISVSQNYDPVIAALPLMVLATLASFLTVYLVRWGGGVGWDGGWSTKQGECMVV